MLFSVVRERASIVAVASALCAACFLPTAATACVDWPSTSILLSGSEAVSRCLQNGADPNATDTFGDPVIVIATRYVADAAVLRVLIASGADPDTRSSGFNQPAILFAAMWRDEVSVALVGTLLEAGADVSLFDDIGDTALHGAAFIGSPQTVQLLLENGADLNSRNMNGQTPLQAAIDFTAPETEGRYEVILTLLDAGADEATRARNGMTAREYAASLLVTPSPEQQEVRMPEPADDPMRVLCYSTAEEATPDAPIPGMYVLEQLDGVGEEYLIPPPDDPIQTDYNRFDLQIYPSVTVSEFDGWESAGPELLAEMIAELAAKFGTEANVVSVRRSIESLLVIPNEAPSEEEIDSLSARQIYFSYLGNPGRGWFRERASVYGASLTMPIHCYSPFLLSEAP